ncbi:MAG: stage VI sporulation protein F [Tenericutes bacterium]|nr:stage VI sporulation protein F [Mycoplasmatota bacterium]
MNDELFQKVEKKTKVGKDKIISLAKMVNDNGLKDEKTLKEVISELSVLTGKKVDKTLESKIINAVMDGKVPKGGDIEKMF